MAASGLIMELRAVVEQGQVLTSPEDLLLEEAGRAVGAILAAGVVPLALEMMDRVTLRCVEEYLQQGLPLDCAAMLLIDVDGDRAAVAAQRAVVAEVCRAGGATVVQVAANPAESQQLLQARRSVSSSLELMRAIKSALDPHGLLNPGKLLG